MEMLKNKYFKGTLFGVFIVALIVSWLAFGDRGFVYLRKMEKERRDSLARIEKLNIANQKLKDEIDKLRRNDPEIIEKTARKEFGLLKENEVVYKFSND